jgi:hypothetical protein
MLVAVLCGLIMAACLYTVAGAGAAARSGGSCQLKLGVTLHRAHGANGSTRSFTSTPGTASCSGKLGPWVMNNQSGWAISNGTVQESAAGAPASGSGQLFAQAPRTAYFYPAMVTLSASFRLKQANGVLQVTGAGRLISTHKSPVARKFTVTGTATFAGSAGSNCTANRCSGTLTLQIAVHSS